MHSTCMSQCDVSTALVCHSVMLVRVHTESSPMPSVSRQRIYKSDLYRLQLITTLQDQYVQSSSGDKHKTGTYN